MSGRNFAIIKKYRAHLIFVAALVLLWQGPGQPVYAAPISSQTHLQHPMPIEQSMPKAGGICSYCGAPPVDDAAGFVVTSLFTDGNYVVVWLSKQDGRAHARCHAPNGRKAGADILIPADTSEGLLPVPFAEADGKFRLTWSEEGKSYTGRFDCQGMLLGKETRDR